ncbi:MAG: acetate--CoA ligase family protein [Thermodesulfobacteriota bacterium]
MRTLTILDQVRREGRKILSEFEAKRFLKQEGIPVVETRLSRTQKEAISIAQRLGFPVVLKISSPDIVHKSDFGGVRLSLKNVSEVKIAYKEIIEKTRKNYPQATIQGVTIQKMARPGIEVIVGTSQDPQFGPVIMFGLGGLFVEILKDVSFRIIPISQKDAEEMVKEIKGYPLLSGYRGREPANISALVEVLLRVSRLIERYTEIKELELNPLFAYKDGVLGIDARIILESCLSR